MELTRQFAQRRLILLGLVGVLVMGSFLALPQGQAFASALLVFFRGQTVQAVPTSYADLENAYAALNDLGQLGTMQGTIPSHLNTVASLAAAETMAGFTLAQPSTFPIGISHTASSFKALAPAHVTLTLDKTRADAYFKSHGSRLTMPATYTGTQLIMDFPGVAVVQYTGNGRLLVGQAGQMLVHVSGNATLAQVHDYLVNLPTLPAATITALKGMQNWQSTVPLGVPTDRLSSWKPTSVGGSVGGAGYILNDNTGIASAVLWQQTNGSQSFGVAGSGLKASDVQSVAGSLH